MEKTLTTTVKNISIPFDASILAGQLRQSSIDMYQRDFLVYVAYAGTVEEAFKATVLAQCRKHLAQGTDLSPNTINRMLAAVKRLMTEAAIQGYTTHENAEAFEQIRGVKGAPLVART